MAEIFISYAHLDNHASKDEAGWIDEFRRELKNSLQRYLGRKPKIWRDKENLGRNDLLKEKIFNDLAEVTILLPLLSPSFFASDWCPDELDRFVSGARPHPILKIEDRVFKILLFPDQMIGQLPSVVNDKLGYEFFLPKSAESDLAENPWDFREIGPRSSEFLNRLTDLVKDLCQTLNGAKGETKGTAYVARPSRDMDARYLSVVRELTSQGYEVVPNPQTRLPDSLEEFEKVVRESLERSSLSIHLFGNRERDENSPADFSSQHLECLLAREACANDQLTSIMWAPGDLANQTDSQKSFITRELESGEIPRNLEIIRMDFRVFKDAISQKLESLEKKRTTAQSVKESGEGQDAMEETVYLVYEKSDRADPHRREIAAFFGAEELEVLTPLPDDEEIEISQILEEHRKKLKESAGVLVYSGASGSKWLDAQKRDVMKQCPGKDQEVCFYLGPPKTDYKEYDFTAPRRARMVRNDGEFDSSLLREFVNALKNKKGT